MLYPMELVPVYKEYLWGGSKLKTKYNKSSSFEKVAESWELSTHDDGVCGISNGRFAGWMFTEYLSEMGSGVLGSNLGDTGEFPILVKYIDADDNLSVQVHPGEEYARQNEGSAGKTEFWYVMDCEEGAALYFGFKNEIKRDEFIKKAQDGSIVEDLNCIPVKKGDVFHIEPGTVHAIGKGITVAEVSTNCNITYRLYDFDRVDATGNKRPLHIEKAADVFKTGAENKAWQNDMIDCGPFRQTLIKVSGILDVFCDGCSFQCLMCVEGSAMIDRSVTMQAGSSVFIPAGMGAYTLRGDATLLMTTV